MAIFPKNGTDRPLSSRSDAVPGETGMSIIAAGMKLTGDIETAGVVKIEGTIEGSIRGARQVLLGRQGTIHGDVRAIEIVVGGTVIGTIFADDRVEIEATSSVQGDINTKSIVVHEGGRINGTVRMGDSVDAAHRVDTGDASAARLALSS
jgi:cytoskeletal protein CcmA (bactofilin family)